jgi:hypothetical protein
MSMGLSHRACCDLLYFLRVGDAASDVLGQKVERTEWLTWRINDGPELLLLPAIDLLMNLSGYHPL